MSQFDTSYPPDSAFDTEQKTSGLAVASLVCSLICCLPITTIPGILLGAAALVSIGNNPARRGKGLAVAGILLGAIFTGAQAYVYPKFGRIIVESFRLVERGPRDALAAGFAGDPAGFRAEFHGPAAAASDAEVQALIDELESRYGGFVGSRMDQSRQQQQQPAWGKPIAPFPYVLEFENAEVPATVELAFADENTGEMVMALQSLTVHDDELGDLLYPPQAEQEPAPQEPAPQEPPGDEPSGGEATGEEPGGGGTAEGEG